jgi:hypothetical protein
MHDDSLKHIYKKKPLLKRKSTLMLDDRFGWGNYAYKVHTT